MPDQTIWLNIDIPLKRCTVHGDPKCPYVQNMVETRYKGIDRLKRDGGWLRFGHIREAREFHLARYDQFQWREHCYASSDIVPVAESRTGKEINPHYPGVSFNSVTDHYQTVLGWSGKKVDNRLLPRGLKVFYGLVVAVLLICFILMAVALWW